MEDLIEFDIGYELDAEAIELPSDFMVAEWNTLRPNAVYLPIPISDITLTPTLFQACLKGGGSEPR
jgi:hypothetical protein